MYKDRIVKTNNNLDLVLCTGHVDLDPVDL